MSVVKSLKTLAISGIATLGAAPVALAQDDDFPIQPISGFNGDFNTFINALIHWVLGLVIIAAVALLIYAGFLYITAAGDEGKISTATRAVTYSIVGLIVAFAAYVLVMFALSFLFQGA